MRDTWGRLAALTLAAGAFVAVTATGPAASAEPASPAPPATPVTVVPGAEAEDPRFGALGPNCTSPFCGRIVNRTPAALLISQNYADGSGCVGPYEWVEPGQNSNAYYKDTDCVLSYWCAITIDGTGPFSASTWVKFSSLPWTQEVRCG